MRKITRPEKISLLNNPDVPELLIQDQIANNPSILGLGELTLKDRERKQPRAGRLDILLQDTDSERRFEVEVQLGKTDESHIIRTLEYWDIERKRYPQYEHVAVIVAEEITSRFLNVISLFNGFIPLVAIQMNAFKCDDDIALTFTTVLNEISIGTDEEEVAEPADRNYWLERGTEETVEMAEQFLKVINEVTGKQFALKFNKHYIGLAERGVSNNFIILKAKKSVLNLEFKMPASDDVQKKIDKSDLDDMGYKWEGYRVRLSSSHLKSESQLLKELVELAYKTSGS